MSIILASNTCMQLHSSYFVIILCITHYTLAAPTFLQLSVVSLLQGLLLVLQGAPILRLETVDVFPVLLLQAGHDALQVGFRRLQDRNGFLLLLDLPDQPLDLRLQVRAGETFHLDRDETLIDHFKRFLCTQYLLDSLHT